MMVELTSGGLALFLAWQSIREADLHRFLDYLSQWKDVMSMQACRILSTSHGISCLLFLNILLGAPWWNVRLMNFLWLSARLTCAVSLNEVCRTSWTIIWFFVVVPEYCSAVVLKCYFMSLANPLSSKRIYTARQKQQI